MIYQLLFRENGALGLPTVALISQSNNDCLNYAIKNKLEFMPTDDLSCIEIYIYLPDGDFSADIASGKQNLSIY